MKYNNINKYLKKYLIYVIGLSFTYFPIIAYSNNFQFNNIYMFGDSLSDTGYFGNNIRYIAGKNQSDFYIELLSLKYTGRKILPSSMNGSNYSMAGSVGTTEMNRANLKQMVDNFIINNQNKKIDDDDLFIIWIIGNDIRLSLNKIIKHNLFHQDNNKNYTLNDAPKQITEQAKRLINLGAKYVLIGNIYDPNYTPYKILLPTIFLDGQLGKLFKKERFYFTENILGSFFYKDLINKVNLPDENDPDKEKGIKLINERNRQILSRYLLKNFYNNVVGNLLSKTIKQFNYTLEKNLEEINQNNNIIFFDSNKLIYEIVNNPLKYGFTDIIMPLCQLGQSSLTCIKDSKFYNKNKTFLWSDWFHPSPELHKLIFEYISSIIDAPIYVSSIAKELSNIANNEQNIISNQLMILRHHKQSKNLKYFINYSDVLSTNNAIYNHIKQKYTNNHNLNFGLTYKITPNLTIGTMLGFAYNHQKPFPNFKYSIANKSISFFILKGIKDKLWLENSILIGYSSFYNIERYINLYKGVNVETAKTKGTYQSMSTKLIYQLIDKNNLKLNSILGFSFNHYKINGYKEKDETHSTSMHFGSTNYNKNILTLGFELTKSINNLNLYSNISLNYTLNKDKIAFKSALNSTKLNFIMNIPSDKRVSLSLNLGSSYQHKNLIYYNNLNYNTYKSRKNFKHIINYSLGLKF